MALLFSRNVNGFPMTRERLGVVVVSMRSEDPGPDCPQYPGWNSRSTEPKFEAGEWMCLEVLAKDLRGPPWYRPGTFHLLNRSCQPEY